MTLATALYTLVQGDGSVNGMIGDRMYPHVIPEGDSLPAISFFEVTTDELSTHDGSAGIAISRLQFNCHADSPDQAKQLARLVRAAIRGYRGTVDGTKIDGIRIAATNDDPDRELREHRRIIDVMVTHDDI